MPRELAQTVDRYLQRATFRGEIMRSRIWFCCRLSYSSARSHVVEKTFQYINQCINGEWWKIWYSWNRPKSEFWWSTVCKLAQHHNTVLIDIIFQPHVVPTSIRNHMAVHQIPKIEEFTGPKNSYDDRYVKLHWQSFPATIKSESRYTCITGPGIDRTPNDSWKHERIRGITA